MNSAQLKQTNPAGAFPGRDTNSEPSDCNYRKSSINPLGAYFFQALLRGGGGLNREGGGLFNLAKRITCSKNTVV